MHNPTLREADIIGNGPNVFSDPKPTSSSYPCHIILLFSPLSFSSCVLLKSHHNPTTIYSQIVNCTLFVVCLAHRQHASFFFSLSHFPAVPPTQRHRIIMSSPALSIPLCSSPLSPPVPLFHCPLSPCSPRLKTYRQCHMDHPTSLASATSATSLPLRPHISSFTSQASPLYFLGYLSV